MRNIEVENLSVEFEEKKVLSNVSFSVNEGEFICIIGKNGSGKSTLAKTLNALLLPTSGDVLIYGKNTKDVEKIIDIRKTIGMVFQNPDNQIVASIVEEDVAFGLENIGIETNEMRKRIEDAMSSLGIQDLKKELTSRLSGGQKQKIAIAGILAMKSKIIVLDEPTSMIDMQGRKEILETIKKLNKNENITIILISHNIDEIMYADRVIVLDSGKLKIDDTPKNILLKSEELKSYDIELPYISKVATYLKNKGLNYRGNETEIDELIMRISNK